MPTILNTSQEEISHGQTRNQAAFRLCTRCLSRLGLSLMSSLFSTDGPRKANTRRSTRYPFVARAEIGDIHSGLRLYARVTKISANGCFLEMAQPLPEGKEILIKIFTATEFFEAGAIVAYSQPDLGVGLEFRDVSRHFQPALHRWLLQAMREAVLPQNPSDPNS
jgi:hypothetical protein